MEKKEEKKKKKRGCINLRLGLSSWAFEQSFVLNLECCRGGRTCNESLQRVAASWSCQEAKATDWACQSQKKRRGAEYFSVSAVPSSG